MDGGFFSELWKGYEQFGICPETDLPYQPKFDVALEPATTAQESAKTLRTLGLSLHWIKEWDVHTGLTKSLKVTMEHKGNREDSADAFYIERPDYFNSIAFWYQTGLPKPTEPLPGWPERCVPWHNLPLVRTFRQATITPTSSTSATEMATSPSSVRVQTTGFFGGRPTLTWPTPRPAERLSLPFTVATEGRYAIRLVAFIAPDFGRFAISIDDQVALSYADFAAQDAGETDLLLGTHTLTAGTHTLTFEPLADGNATETAGGLAVEILRLLALPPEAVRTVRTHNEAHFIRLGIGRAVYAYRLAYDALPESLETLVDSGIMEARFLTDENFLPLTCQHEGDALLVQSTAPNGWHHRFYGLDARR